VNRIKFLLLSRVKTTKLKIAIAGIISFFIIKLLRTEEMQILRNNIRYSADLTEGIDFSIFLLGNFQKYVVQNKLFSIPKNAIIFDVGANFGFMSLQFSKAVPYGHVYAIEPTHYAFKRLKKNLRLNPNLSNRITAVQAFFSDKNQKKHEMKAFSSWKVYGKNDKREIHPIHSGAMKSTEGVEAIRLDNFCKSANIEKVDFIKIDTDGNEHEVLIGAEKIIAKNRPVVIFEIGNYLLEEKKIKFNYFLEYFYKYNYSLFDAASGINLTEENFSNIIPKFSTIDIIALPNKDYKKTN